MIGPVLTACGVYFLAQAMFPDRENAIAAYNDLVKVYPVTSKVHNIPNFIVHYYIITAILISDFQ